MSPSSEATENKNNPIMLYFLLIIACCIWLLYRQQNWQHKSKLFLLGELIPGPKRLPLIGNAHLVFGKKTDEIVRFSLEHATLYGSVIRFWLGSNLYVILTDPNDVEVILHSQIHIDKSMEYTYFEPWLGNGLLISTGEKWRSDRKMIAPTFHINILKTFIGVFNENSKNIVNKMKSQIGTIFDVHDQMSRVTVDILLETAMGITRKTQNDNSGFDYAKAVMKMCDIIHQRNYKIWLHFEKIFRLTSLYKQQKKLLNVIHGLTNKVIKNKTEAYLENRAKGIVSRTLEELTHVPESADNETLADTIFNNYPDDLDDRDNNVDEKKRLAFLDLMIETAKSGSNKISDREIKEQVDTIMFEGHDTTAAGSSFVLCLLGVHQQVQAKVYDELYKIFGDSDRPATFNDTLEMKYLERVIFESLRLFPPVPIFGRSLKQDVQIVTKKYVLPAGTTVAIATYKVHRDPNHFKDPEVFDPDNFLPENTQSRHFYSFIPFSAGPRSCVGRKYALLKLKVLLSTILRNYKVVSDVTQEQFKLQADIILKRSDGFNIKIEPRVRIP